MPKPKLNKRRAASPFRTAAGVPRLYISAVTGKTKDDMGKSTQKIRRGFTLRGTARPEVVEEAISLWIKTQGLAGTISIVHQQSKKKKAAPAAQ